MFALFAVSLDLLVGVTGLPSLGHAAYFGAGAYAAGLGVDQRDRGGAGPAAGRGRGRGAGRRAHRLDHGAQPRGVLPDAHPGHRRDAAAAGRLLGVGHRRRQRPDRGARRPDRRGSRWPTPGSSTGTCWRSSCVGFALVWLVARSPFGAALRGIRDNEPRMRALGYADRAATSTRCSCSPVASPGWPARCWSPSSAWSPRPTSGSPRPSFALLAVIIGGAGSLWGACLGAALVVLVRDALGPSLDGHGTARARRGVRAGGLPAAARGGRAAAGAGWRTVRR